MFIESHMGRKSSLLGQGDIYHGEGAAAPIFDYDRILAFSDGKPSEAFGEP